MAGADDGDLRRGAARTAYQEEWVVGLGETAGDVAGLEYRDGELRLRQPRRTGLTGGRPGGMRTFTEHRVDRSVDKITAIPDADVPPGTSLAIEVRGRDARGRWSEWLAAEPATEPAAEPAAESVSLPLRARAVQARAIFTGNGARSGRPGTVGAGPVLRGLRLRGVDTGAVFEKADEPVTYRVYATREGLVGHTTANGHKIKKNDRFVALPSRRALASDGGDEYTVTIRYRGRTVTAPVWDVGPWNTKDDYWNPAETRERFSDLPRGKPEAQAAYQDGYNDGKDGFGRTVRNPAGIDLADGTFWHDLKMTDNDWVEVTYNWTGDAGTVVDDGDDGFTAGDGWESATAPEAYGSGYHRAAPSAVDRPAWFRVEVPDDGDYEVAVWYPADPDNNPATPFLVRSATGLRAVQVDQRSDGGTWVSLGEYRLAAGGSDVVGVSRLALHPGYLAADAIRLTPVQPSSRS